MNTQRQTTRHDISYIVELRIAEDGRVKDTVLMVPGSTSKIVLETLSGQMEVLGERLNEVALSSNTHFCPAL